jgi:hypothetical protein
MGNCTVASGEECIVATQQGVEGNLPHSRILSYPLSQITSHEFF